MALGVGTQLGASHEQTVALCLESTHIVRWGLDFLPELQMGFPHYTFVFQCAPDQREGL